MFVYLNLIHDEKHQNIYRKIYEDNYLRLYHIALSILKEPADAEDAVHEAFLSFAKNFRRYANLSCREMERLIVTIVKNKVIDQLRYRKRFSDEELENLVLYSEYEEFDPERNLEMKDEYNKVQQILKNLPEILRMTLELKFSYGYSNKDISKIMNVSVKTVEMRLYRAKIKLKELWEYEE